MKNRIWLFAPLLAAAACTTAATDPGVQTDGRLALKKAVEARGWIATPAPVSSSDHREGSVQVRQSDQISTAIGKCRAAFDRVDRTPPAQDDPAREAWGNVTQNVTVNVGGNANTGPGLPSGLTATLSGGFTKIANYTLDFGVVEIRQLALPDEILLQTSVDGDCDALIKAMAATPTMSPDDDPSATVKDSLFLVTGAVTALNITYTFTLNPQASGTVNSAPPADDAQAQEIRDQCGANFDAGLTSIFKALPASGFGLNLSQCRNGSFSVITNEPMVVAWRTAPLSDWNTDGAHSAGEEATYELSPSEPLSSEAAFDAAVPSISSEDIEAVFQLVN